MYVGHLYILFCQAFVQVLVHFSIESSLFFLLMCLSSFIFYIWVLCQMYVLQIPSLTQWADFSLLFDEQRLLISKWFNVSYFPSWLVSFVSYLRKNSLQISRWVFEILFHVQLGSVDRSEQESDMTWFTFENLHICCYLALEYSGEQWRKWVHVGVSHTAQVRDDDS